MPKRRPSLSQIRTAIRVRAYDMTAHAVEEMAEDGLDILDIEGAILNGDVVSVPADDLPGTRVTVHGTAADGLTPVAVVGRFTEIERFLIITVYEVTDSCR